MKISVNDLCTVLTGGDSKTDRSPVPIAPQILLPRYHLCLSAKEGRKLIEKLIQAIQVAEAIR